jgi:hypothetical protein
MVRRVGVALLLGSVLVPASACSSSSKDSSANSTAGGSTTVATSPTGSKAVAAGTACRYVDQSDATTLFGINATQLPPTQTQIPESECLWRAADTEGRIHLLQVHVCGSDAAYGPKFFPHRQEVTGLGEKAFIDRGQAENGVTVQFLRDGQMFSVNYSISAAESSAANKDALAKADQLLTMLKQNVSRL